MPKTPSEVLQSTDPEIKKLVSQVLAIEKGFQNYKHLTNDNKKEIARKIAKKIREAAK